MKQTWLVGLLLLSLAVATTGMVLTIAWQGQQNETKPAVSAAAPAPPSLLVVSGRIEGRTLSVDSPSHAMVGTLRASPGQVVEPGDILLLLEAPQLNERVQATRQRRDELAANLAAADDMLKVLRADIRQQVQAAEQKRATMSQQVAERREQYERASHVAERLESKAKDNLVASRIAEPAKLRTQMEKKAETDMLTAQLKAARYRTYLLDARSTLANSERELALAEASSQKLEAMAADIRYKHMQASQAENVLKDREAELAALTIRSPERGVLISMDVDPGQKVAPGTRLLTLALADRLYFKARVPAKEVVSLDPGVEAMVRVDTWPDRQFQARIVEISRRTAVATESHDGHVSVGSVSLEILDNSEGLLKPGMAAHTILNLPHKE